MLSKRLLRNREEVEDEINASYSHQIILCLRAVIITETVPDYDRRNGTEKNLFDAETILEIAVKYILISNINIETFVAKINPVGNRRYHRDMEGNKERKGMGDRRQKKSKKKLSTAIPTFET